MRVDVKTLGTFNDLAKAGAERAATQLADLVDSEVSVDISTVEIVPVPDLALEFSGTLVRGVELEFGKDMAGTLVLVFEEDSADVLLENMLPASMSDDPAMYESGITEAANILAGGFLAAWGEQTDRALHPEPPEYIEGEWEMIMPHRMEAWTEHQTVLTFASELHCLDKTIDFNLYMFPERDSFEDLVGEISQAEQLPLSVEKLSAFNEMTKAGAKRASEKISEMTDIRTTVQISRMTVIPMDEVSRYISAEPRVGATATLEAPPGGAVAVLFDEESAVTIGDALLPVEPDGTGLTDQHHSAIEEIGNIMVSGFIDGWANALDRKIPHNPPSFIEIEDEASVDPLLTQFDEDRQYAFLLNSTINTTGDNVTCSLLALPAEIDFQTVIEEMSLESATEAIYEPDKFEPGSYEDLS